MFKHFWLEWSWWPDFSHSSCFNLTMLSQGYKYTIPDKNCPLTPFCTLSHSWFHPLQNKGHCSLSPTTFLCPPLDLASEAVLIPCRTKPHCPLSPATSLCLSLALAFSQMLLKARLSEKTAVPFFSQPDSLLIKLWTWDTSHEPPLCAVCSIFLTFWCHDSDPGELLTLILLSQSVNSGPPNIHCTPKPTLATR
jgi:hypothetical protein